MWKMILGKEKRKVTNKRTKETRDVYIYDILTNLKYCLNINQWEETEDEKESILEIDGKMFKRFGAEDGINQCDFVQIINSYIRTKRINPIKDIKSITDVKELYEEMIEEAQRIFDLKITKEKLTKKKGTNK